jgi:ElaB/YqjD/DUF883 family membrane-anchored ribosome-binding protein
LADPNQGGFNYEMLICIVDFYQRITSKRMRDYEIELNELRHTIQAEARAGLAEVTQTTSSTVAKLPSNLTELDTLLRKIGDQLSDVAGEAEDTIASHPIYSVGAALILGIAIGRLTRRGKS